MTTISSTDDDLAGEQPPGETTGRRWLPAVLMLVAVGIAAGLPLFRNTIFYYWDDTAGAAVAQWRRIAEAVGEGHFPLLNLDMWRGGNFAAEAATGMWNPIMLLVALATHLIDNMALAITIAKTLFMGIMALGSYFLAREYGVGRNLSATMGLALPLAGYSFFMDSTAWINALMLTAFIPWVWLTGRRALHGHSLFWFILAGYLCCSLGNPYSLLAVGFLSLGLLVEAWLTGRRERIGWLIAAGAAIGLLVVMVYLPLLMSTSVGVRAGSTTFNDEFLAPNLSNMLGMSTPTAQPYVRTFGRYFLVYPGLYLAWFVLPMLPWLRWKALRSQWRPLSGLLVFGGISLLTVLGPSNLWMFRWPLRLIDFLWFPVLLLWMIVANQGFRKDRFRLRMVLSLSIVALGAYLGWADMPQNIVRLVVGSVAVAVLVVLFVWSGAVSRTGLAVLLVGTVGVLAVQLHYFPRNDGVANYRMPTSQQELQQRFAKYKGVTVQIASTATLNPRDMVPDRIYKDVLFGNMYGVTGTESTTSYTGIGFTKFDSLLCIAYQGSTCPDAWDNLWKAPKGYDVPLADLVRAETVVVQNSLVDTREDPPPAGWRRDRSAEDSGLVTVYRRIDPLPNPDGRVSHASDGVTVSDDKRVGDVDETLSFRRDDAGDTGALTFARLNWPGYTATVNGKPTTVRTASTGFVVVDLPKGVESGEVELTWTVPGASVSRVAFGAGILLTILLVALPWWRRRRTAGAPDSPAAQSDPTDTTSEDGTMEPVTASSAPTGGQK